MDRRYPGVFLRGVAMGAADVVPGVSGGTIAYITGIYDELIDSVKACDITALRLLSGGDVVACWRHINGTFLVSLIAGIGVSVLSLARLISYLLVAQPTLVAAFFFGLILASAWFVYRQIPQSRWRLLWLAVGIVFAVMLGETRPTAMDVTPVTVFLSGALAICAMILPGISGSFILLLLGMYEPIIAAIKALDIQIALIFVAGCATGLILFVRLLSWMLHRHRAPLLSWLTGVLLGSLTIIWPWKQQGGAGDAAHATVIAADNILPWQAAGSSSQQIAACVGLMFFGFILVLVLEYFSEQKP